MYKNSVSGTKIELFPNYKISNYSIKIKYNATIFPNWPIEQNKYQLGRNIGSENMQEQT